MPTARSQPVTLAQLAARLGVVPDSLRQRVHRGTLAAYKIGNQWVVSEATAEAEVAKSQATKTRS